MKLSSIMGMSLLALSTSVLASENNNQFIFSNTHHGNVCNQSPNVWTLGGELIVDAPIKLNGKMVTRTVELAANNTLDALTNQGDNLNKVELMSQSVSCIKTEQPIELIGAVSALYKRTASSLSNSDIPAEIPVPDLPVAPEIVKDQFETKAQFQARVEKISQQRQSEVNAIQAQYRQLVEARNEEIKKLQSNLNNNKQLAGNNTPFVAHAYRDVMGKPMLSAKSYDAENSKMYITFKSSNQNYSRDVVLNVPQDKAREVYQNIELIDLSLVYGVSESQIDLVDIYANFQGNTFTGDLTTTDYQPEALSVKLPSSEVALAKGEMQLQNPNLVDRFDVDSQLTLVEKGSGDELQSLLASLSPAPEDKSKWFFNLAIEDYANSDEIAFSRQSGETMKSVANKALGVPERHIYSLIDQQATSGAIKDKLRLMLDNIDEGDTVYFYYSGHGIPVLPDNEPYILPQDKIPDYIKDEPYFKLNNIYRTLSDSKAGKIVVLVDSCFSGATDGVSVIKGVAASRLVPKAVAIDQQRMVVITAGRDKEYSNMYVEKGQRLFSYYLMKSIIEGKHTIEELYQEVYENVKTTSFDMGDLKRQHPTLTGNKSLSL